jgi:predicted ABC-type ATPase
MSMGSLLLLAGPNGAGKTSLFQSLRARGELQDYLSLNADERTLQRLRGAGFTGFGDPSVDVATLKRMFIESATEVYQEAASLLEAGKAVCLETVLSTDKFCNMVTQVTEGGGTFELIYIALRSADVSRRRVQIRVCKDGHDVPTDRLHERWARSLSFLPWFARRAHEVAIFDNSDANPVLVAKGSGGTMSWLAPRESVFPELRLALEAEFPELRPA